MARRRVWTAVAATALTACGMLAGGAIPASGAAVLTIPASIPSTCGTTASPGTTQAINAWIAAAPNGTAAAPTILDFRSGCYLLDDPARPFIAGNDIGGTAVPYGVVINNKNFITVRGTATLKHNTPAIRAPHPSDPTNPDPNRTLYYANRAQLSVLNSSDIKIGEGGGPSLSLIGIRPAGTRYAGNREQDHNLRVQSAHRVRVDGVTLKAAYGDNLGVRNGASIRTATNPQGRQGEYFTNLPDSTDITLANSTLDGASRHNVTFASGARLTLDNNSLLNAGYFSLDTELHSYGTELRDITVSNNHATSQTPGYKGFIYIVTRNESAPAGNGVRNVTISGNTVDTRHINGSMATVTVNRGTVNAAAITENVKIINNNLIGQKSLVDAYAVKGLLIQGNVGQSKNYNTECLARPQILVARRLLINVQILDNSLLPLPEALGLKKTGVYCLAGSPQPVNLVQSGDTVAP